MVCTIRASNNNAPSSLVKELLTLYTMTFDIKIEEEFQSQFKLQYGSMKNQLKNQLIVVHKVVHLLPSHGWSLLTSLTSYLLFQTWR